MKTDLGKCKKLLDSGLSLVCVGNNKIPNFPWKDKQTSQYSKDIFEKDYNYSGGIIKKNGEEIPATAGVGIITGFNGLEVFDIDLKIFKTLKEQQDFWAEYISFLRDNILDFDDKFVIYKTINGGYHILYQCAVIGGNAKIAKLKGHSEAIIETRGIGGYVFVYENKVSKKSYFELQEISQLDREVLFSVSKYYDYVEEKDILIPEKLYVETNTSETTPWSDYNNKTSIFDVIGSEFDIIKQLSDKYIIRRHGATSPHSGYVYKNSGCMYLFSTGTIYPNEKLISPFTAFTYKYHNKDFSSAAKDIYKKGFGSRVIKVVPELQIDPPVDYGNIEFPLDIFPKEIQNYMIQCRDTLDNSIDYMGCSFLWMLSVIIGNSVKIQVKPGWVEPATVWMTVVGKAGIGKTPSISSIVFPLQKENNREIKKFVKSYDKFNEFMELDKKDRENTEQIKRPKKTQFIADDITLEALVDLHEENKNSVGVFKDELAGWIKDMNKYRAGSDLEFWLSTWSAKSVSLNRKTAKSAFVAHPLIPVLGGIQPGIFDSFYNDENKDNGFIDRMLLCYPDLTVEEYNDRELDFSTINWYNDYMVAFYNNIKQLVVEFDTDDEIKPMIAIMDSEAKIEWKRIFNKITAQQNDDGENEYMKSMLPKQKSYIPRFALLISCVTKFNNSESKDRLTHICKSDLIAAEKLSDYFIKMAKKIKISSTEINDIKQMLRLNVSKPKHEQFLALYQVNPNLNRSEVAEKLGVSRKTIQQWVNKCNPTVTQVTPKNVLKSVVNS
ncbi:MAG: DUF3987 domain-containing protein [Mucilaginibacter sp.]|uniref:DUF3987 domain-containing protein n=1 Tax=Mucilaginibacter sp. TaxID=1882438 RepID=UPI0032676332